MTNTEEKIAASKKLNYGHEFRLEVGEKIESMDESGKSVERASTLVIDS